MVLEHPVRIVAQTVVQNALDATPVIGLIIMNVNHGRGSAIPSNIKQYNPPPHATENVPLTPPVVTKLIIILVLLELHVLLLVHVLHVQLILSQQIIKRIVVKSQMEMWEQ